MADQPPSESLPKAAQPTVAARVDANHQRGIGHAMRCLAVAERLIARGYRVVFAMHELPDQLRPKLMSSGVEIHLLSDTDTSVSSFCSLVTKLEAGFVILDGYDLGDDFEQAFKGTAVRTLRFDDYMPGKRCHADIIVNASPHAEPHPYRKWAPCAKLLLGPHFIVYRSDMIESFKARARPAKGRCDQLEPPTGNTIMVNFGGSDPLDMTIATVSALASAIPDAQIEAVTGAAYPQPERLKALHLPTLVHHHNSDNLPQIMQRTTLAISAGGLTVQELALFRIPTILVITAENQIKASHVTWCHTLRLDWNQGQPDKETIIREIVGEATMLWNSPAERGNIIARIPVGLDTKGADRIADALTGQKQG